MTGWVMAEHGVPDSRLTVICQAEDYITPKGIHIAQWLVECNCIDHKKFICAGRYIKNGHTRSCGCLKSEVQSERCKSMKKVNTYDLSGEYGIGYCSNTNNPFYFDLEDYDKIKDYYWYEARLSKKYHPVESHIPNSGKIVKMHQLIFGKDADHKNRNPMDNRKDNLRECTQQENCRNSSLRSDNSSGIIGVAFDSNRNKWRARIKTGEIDKHLGYFINKDDAIKSRLEAEVKYFGEFAPQRHLFGQYGITIQNELEESDELQVV